MSTAIFRRKIEEDRFRFKPKLDLRVVAEPTTSHQFAIHTLLAQESSLWQVARCAAPANWTISLAGMTCRF
jgi:hypothetical protein